MTRGHRSLWLLLPVAFGATLLGALSLYFLPELRSMVAIWFAAGQLVGDVVVTSWGVVLVAAFCVLLGSPIRASEAVLLGIALATSVFVLGLLLYLPVAAGLSPWAVKLCYKLVVPAVGVWAFHRLRAHMARGGVIAA